MYNGPWVRPVASFFVWMLIVPVVPLAAEGLDAAAPTCREVYVDGVGMACPLPNGHYAVTLADGKVLHTHGPDPGPDPEPLGASGLEPRAPRCATDWYQHVLYGHPANRPNRSADVEDLIRSSILSMNALLNLESIEAAGVTADYKMLCDESGQVRIDSFAVPSSSNDFNAIVSAARSAGFRNTSADYTIFYDASHSTYCGVGSFAYDESPGPNNANNRGGDYGVTYQGCWAGRTPMHENGHNQGAVQRTAPLSDLTGHCLEGQDVMCYPTSQVLVLCADRIHYDCRNDAYFHPDPPSGSWLATHWNIGSRVNRFIAFGDTSPPDNLPPVASFTVEAQGRNVTVNASASTDPDGDALSFSWEFGDGSNASGVLATHQYAQGGGYTIGLTVLDGQGGVARAQQRVTFGIAAEPRVELFAGEGRIVCSIAFSPLSTAELCGPLGDPEQSFSIPFAPGATAVRVEVAWDSGSGLEGAFGAQQMTYAWASPGGLPGASGPSPLVGEHEVDPASPLHQNGAEGRLDVRPSGSSGLVHDQAFKVCVAVAYGGAALPVGPACGA